MNATAHRKKPDFRIDMPKRHVARPHARLMGSARTRLTPKTGQHHGDYFEQPVSPVRMAMRAQSAPAHLVHWMQPVVTPYVMVPPPPAPTTPPAPQPAPNPVPAAPVAPPEAALTGRQRFLVILSNIFSAVLTLALQAALRAITGMRIV